MAREPPVSTCKPPDESHQRRPEKKNKTHQESSSNSFYSSTNSRNNEAMHIALSEGELDGIQKLISSDRERLIHRKLVAGNDSTNQELQHTKNLDESIVPIKRTDVAISGNFTEKSPELRLQIRPSSHQLHDDLTTGVCSPDEGVHLNAIPSKMDGPIVGDKNSNEQVAGKSKSDGHVIRGNYSMDEEVHLTNISNNSGQQHNQKEIQASLIASTAKQQTEVEQLNCSNEAEHQRTYSQDHAGPNGQKQDQLSTDKQKMKMKSKHGDRRLSPDSNDQHDKAGDTTVEVINVESSPQFSFGVKPTDTLASKEGQQRPGKTINYVNEIHYDQMQGHHAGATNSQRKKSNEADIQASKDSHANSNRDAINLSSSETHSNDNAKGQKLIKLNDQERLRGDIESQQYGDQNQNRARTNSQSQIPNHGENSNPNNYHKDFPKISSNYDRHNISNQKNQQTTHPDQSKVPSNPNYNQKAEPGPATNIELVPPRHMTKQGQPAVIYDMDDFMNKLTVDCKYTLIGKFSTTMPKIELIRKSFILQTQLNGGVNIAHYNARHVFIDLYNELDYNTVWTQQRMTIEGKLMRIQAWTPKFRPEEETPIVPIWLLLPGLPWHCFKKEFITPLLESVGKVLYLDTASIKRTRASMAKVKVQVDPTKDRPRHVWIGLDDEDLTIGRWQPIEKELGAELKNMNKGEQGQQGGEHRQIKTREQEEQQQQKTKIWEAHAGKTDGGQSRTAVMEGKYYKAAQKRGLRETNTKNHGTSQRGNNGKNKTIGIDSMLPNPTNPNSNYRDDAGEVEGGKEGGCQEKQPNMQEGVSKGENLSHAMHERTYTDYNTDYRTPATTRQQQSTNQQQVQHQEQSEEERKNTNKNSKNKNQVEEKTAGKQNKGVMAKDMGAKASTSNQEKTPKSKNKPSKKKAQRRENQRGITIVGEQQNATDKRNDKCQTNKGHDIDEYRGQLEDDLDRDNQSLKDPDEEDETSELLIRAFSPYPDKGLEEEIHKVAKKQGLSPRGLHHDRFQFKNQDINTVTAGRPNTRLFSSRSSQ
ncbi:hypothetical protein H5410_036479 [Solanum commersonii]|uniref:DUF4283 domain-containing protein n=1 Tax=Solanum commersonii TaxID=4109 RepID=A0A9J5Y5R6_SOLCO|nr:hypothetical protein H5410_036479 [Solanum commersonii]